MLKKKNSVRKYRLVTHPSTRQVLLSGCYDYCTDWAACCPESRFRCLGSSCSEREGRSRELTLIKDEIKRICVSRMARTGEEGDVREECVVPGIMQEYEDGLSERCFYGFSQLNRQLLKI